MADNINSFLDSLKYLNGSNLQDIGLMGFGFIMLASLSTSLVISGLYLQFYGSRATGSQIHRAFPLLGLSITAIFICIQFSLPLSLGLLGALSIVRFRTPIKEPEEIGFIMLVVAASIATSTFSFYFLLILITFSLIALVIQKFGFKLLNRVTNDGMILLTAPHTKFSEQADALNQLLHDYLVKPTIESVSKSEDNAVVSYSFMGIKPDQDPVTLQAAIAQLLDPIELNVYMNKQATL